MSLSPILPEIQPITIYTMVNNNGPLLNIGLNFVMCERSLITKTALTNWQNTICRSLSPSRKFWGKMQKQPQRWLYEPTMREILTLWDVLWAARRTRTLSHRPDIRTACSLRHASVFKEIKTKTLICFTIIINPQSSVTLRVRVSIHVTF